MDNNFIDKKTTDALEDKSVSNLKPIKKEKIKKNVEYYFNHERTEEGKLDIRKMRILGWCLLAFSAIVTGLNFFLKMKNITNMNLLPNILSSIASLSVSALMIAAFSKILQNQKRGIRLCLLYGGIALAIILGFYLLYFVYLSFGLAHITQTSYVEMVMGLNQQIAKIFGKVLKFNIFIDLFLFSAFILFLFYTPEKIKNNKKMLIAFRLISILPIIYVIVFFFLNVSNALGNISYSTWVYPLLPTKSPLMFISLSTVAVITKIREYKLKTKYHHSDEEYQKFFNSKSNSWMVAKTFAVCLLIFGAIDLIISLFFSLASMGLNLSYEQIQAAMRELCDANGAILEGNKEQYYALSAQGKEVNSIYKIVLQICKDTGIGTASSQILFAPVVLFFTFNKPYKPELIDYFVPLIGVCGIIFVYINWIFVIVMSV